MPNPINGLAYFKCYSLSSLSSIKRHSNSFQIQFSDLQLFEKIWNHTGNQNKGHIFLGDHQAYFLQRFYQPHEGYQLGSSFFFPVELSTTFLILGPHMRPFNNLENKIPSDTYWRVQPICNKEPPLEYRQD